MRRFLVLTLLLFVGSLTAVRLEATDIEANKQTVMKMVDAINQRDFDALDKVVAKNVHRVSGATPDVVVDNLEQFKQYLRTDISAVPDSVQTVKMILGEGDLVAVRAMYSGTQTGQMGPFPPSGKHLDLPFNAILRVKDGLIEEIWVEWDNLNALTQLGYFPPEQQAATPENEPGSDH
jgi:predicted ester cyclase